MTIIKVVLSLQDQLSIYQVQIINFDRKEQICFNSLFNPYLWKLRPLIIYFHDTQHVDKN